MHPDIPEQEELEEIFELTGKIGSDLSKQGLMHAVLEGDKEKIEQGKLITDAINNSVGSFTPDLIFKNLVNDYSIAEQLYGESFIRRISGFNPKYLEDNLHIPEFKRHLKSAIEQRIEELKEQGFVDKEGSITDVGLEIASVTMYVDELNNLIPKGFIGTKIQKRGNVYGEKSELTRFSKQSYRNIAVRKSIKLAIKRGHRQVEVEDLRAFKREGRGQINIVYALDASGSMKGRKLEQCKKAGIALAYKAISEKDKVGLIIFGETVREKQEPTLDFMRILKQIANARATNETDIAKTIVNAVELFVSSDATNHLILITDAVPTKGDEPVRRTLEAVSEARSNRITISVVGIGLDGNGEKLAKRIAEIGEGRLYVTRDSENIDVLVLEDYYEVVG
ncbi:VWA domain-containing protein [Candidatus Woesearchaeota archaeon]|nr:VWA domain-containing protein [Candidatus Woesearchaeota archaeon]